MPQLPTTKGFDLSLKSMWELCRYPEFKYMCGTSGIVDGNIVSFCAYIVKSQVWTYAVLNHTIKSEYRRENGKTALALTGIKKAGRTRKCICREVEKDWEGEKS